MKLLQQFPDVSMQIRRLNLKRAQMEIVSTKEHDDNDNGKELNLYYENEFKKWHTKLAMIILFIISSLLATLIGISQFF